MKLFSKTVLCLLALATSFLLPSIARADEYVTYVLDGTFQSGGTLSGYFTLDVSPSLPTPLVVDALITADGYQFACPDTYSNGCIIGNGFTTYDQFMVGPGPNNSIIEIAWPMDESGTLTLYDGNTYCAGCIAGSTWPDYLVSGTAVDPPYVPAPEPASGAMLLSGIFGVGLIGWKSRRTLQV